LSIHYNGSGGPGGFAIFPDGPSGSGDTKADNPIDVALARKFAERLKATNTVGLIGWTEDRPGVMSERESGVGAQGYRLGELSNTQPLQKTTARLIIEAGAGDVAHDAHYLNDTQWVRYVFAEVVVDALEAQFGKFQTETPVATQP